MLPTIHLSDYQYNLPSDRIRKYAIQQRDKSKLLHYNQGKITNNEFRELPEIIPDNSQLFFNNTKVIPARIHLYKSTGALIEIFLLSPIKPSSLVVEAMETKNYCVWSCMIGNLKKWKNETLSTYLIIKELKIELRASLINREDKQVRFDWDGDYRWVDIVEALGKVPLPPYLDRDPVANDKERYQTIYSENEGAVAAPTAGLHFTDEVISQLEKKKIDIQYLTLHVSAGTFQPVKEAEVHRHQMHSEQIIITRENIEAILSNKRNIAVGTTSLRSIESLYWYGVKLLDNPSATFHIEKLFPYEMNLYPPKQNALSAVLDHMNRHRLDSLHGDTEIFIMPGYRFQVCDGLITNFHQPGSTLLMLIAALVGNDWRTIYNQAMENGYSFLSYGDSSLLIPKKHPTDIRHKV